MTAKYCPIFKVKVFYDLSVKFKKSFNGGSGAVFVDEVEFDDSTQAYLVQVSVPVKDGDAVIGAITFGIDVEKVE
jgi:hypothetical protein